MSAQCDVIGGGDLAVSVYIAVKPSARSGGIHRQLRRHNRENGAEQE